ncbi:hypothetical protein [Pedobacter cryoconitis]|uniref:hypothetical protein n=1 Tax=Pedobacter cryoconitis TaxID=188932 RepID=UPI00161A065F|nr:hypothetical protein [Pedobacter cryoconitis]MBB5645092.1 hypothetical protein [Pedobacter cryoconitis]
MELHKKRILIVGGYGLVGTNIARLIRKEYKSIELILAGRNPQNGEVLARELTNAETAYLNLEDGFELSLYGTVDLMIIAVEDYKNILRETAISNGIACITITELAEDISPTIFLSLHKTVSSPIVLAAHWQAGIITLVAKQLAARFSEINSVDTAGLYDELDPVGPLVASQVDSFVGRALLRQDGNWQFADAKENARTIRLHDDSSITGYPMSTLDVPSIAAFTNAQNVRFDFITGKSIGSKNGSVASHDLYIDIEGVLISGEKTKMRTIISDPKGVSHLTAIGVFLIMEGIFGLGGQSVPQKGGIYLPETIVSTANLMSRLAEFGLNITEENFN